MDKLLCINNKIQDVYFNLAMEEYLLKNYDNNIFMLWQNEPCVVVGKHQNTLAEINLQYVKENNIAVARRLSGGGTVFHDAGNLNFTYIMNGSEGKMVNFIKYTEDIVEALNFLGVPAERNDRNDLHIKDKKISGNAEHVYRNRVIHHGTLLYDSDLTRLNDAIKTEEGKFEDKAVKSVRSRVTNISEYLIQKSDINEFKTFLFNFIFRKNRYAELYDLKQYEYEMINKIKYGKYSTWEWIYGYSPRFSIKKFFENEHGNLHIELMVKKGLIDIILINGTLFVSEEVKLLTELITGLKYEKEGLGIVFESYKEVLQWKGFSGEKFVNLFF